MVYIDSVIFAYYILYDDRVLLIMLFHFK